MAGYRYKYLGGLQLDLVAFLASCEPAADLVASFAFLFLPILALVLLFALSPLC